MATADMDIYAGALKALRDLAHAIPGFSARLQTKEQLDTKQQALVQSRGAVEHIGMSTEKVQLRVGERVGEGTFCVVFRGELLSGASAEAQGKAIAAKFELRRTDATQLRNEFRMYKKLDKCDGFPRIYTFGEIDFHKVLVMDLLGPSLETLFQSCGRCFSIKTVAMLAQQMITRIETLHTNGLIYRDIKPENFLMGLPGTDAANKVFLVDFGMAKVYRDADTNRHIPFGDANALSGTARYMSINAHRRRSQSRRDDLEALGHVLLYFARGNLPWQNVKAPPNDAQYDLMCEKKQATTLDDLCRGFPPELAEYLTYTRSLAFDQDPDYDYLRGLFAKVLDGQGAEADGVFDWAKPKTARGGAAIADGVTEAGEAPQQQQQQQNDAQPLEAHDKTVPRPSTPPQLVSGTGHRPLIVVPPPASPPGGKRRRSEFASDLQPPARSIRAKKAASAFYDGEAQRALASLHRDIMAGRYTFHRTVKQSRGGTAGSAAAAAAAAALSARGIAAMGLYGGRQSMAALRRGVAGRAGAGAAASEVITPAFTEALDKTLGQVVSELEDMSDKLLQDGDWAGAGRVHGWLTQMAASIAAETARLEQEQDKERQKREDAEKEAGAAAAQSKPSSPAAPEASSGSVQTAQHQPPQPIDALISADPLEVGGGDDEDDEPLDEASLRARYAVRPIMASMPQRVLGSQHVAATSTLSAAAATTKPHPGAPASVLPLASTVAPISAVPTRLQPVGSPSAAVRSSMGVLSLEADDQIIAAADDEDEGGTKDKGAEDDNDGGEILELVYRTASGTRRVVRVAEEIEKDGHSGLS